MALLEADRDLPSAEVEAFIVALAEHGNTDQIATLNHRYVAALRLLPD